MSRIGSVTPYGMTSRDSSVLPRSRHAPRHIVGCLLILAGVLVPLLVTAPALAGGARGGQRSARLPVLVSLVFHHSTRGIHDNALPLMNAIGARGTLAVVAHELERTMISPDDVSLVDQPGGMGNVERVSLGEVGADGLFTGRLYLEDPDRRMTDAEIREMAAAGWEIAFHGIGHRTQTSIVAQVDGPGKLGRAYAAGIAEIRRLLDDETLRVRTNTLASNAWNDAVRAVAAATFDWTEVRWAGFPRHVPVVFGLQQDPHGGFNSIDFHRETFDGLGELDDLVRLGSTDPAAWLIIQLHDVVPEPDDSPHPPTALRISEFSYLLDHLQALGARILPFSEAAEIIQQNNPGNRLRNTRFGVNGFLSGAIRLPNDWQMGIWDGAGIATVDLAPDGTIVMTSPAAPAGVVISQAISPWLLRGRHFVLSVKLDDERFWDGSVHLSIVGPGGARQLDVMPGENEACLDFDVSEVGTSNEPFAVSLRIEARDFLGEAALSDLFLGPRRGRSSGCASSRR